MRKKALLAGIAGSLTAGGVLTLVLVLNGPAGGQAPADAAGLPATHTSSTTGTTASTTGASTTATSQPANATSTETRRSAVHSATAGRTPGMIFNEQPAGPVLTGSESPAPVLEQPSAPEPPEKPATTSETPSAPQNTYTDVPPSETYTGPKPGGGETTTSEMQPTG